MLARLFLFLSFFAALAILTGSALAHKLAPTIVDASFDGKGGYELRLRTNLEALLAGIGPAHDDTDAAPEAERYRSLRSMQPGELEAQFRTFLPRWLGSLDIRFDDAAAKPGFGGIAIPEVGDTALARTSTITLAGRVPAGAGAFSWAWPARYGSSILRVQEAGSENMVTQWLKDGARSGSIPLSGATKPGIGQLFADYTWLGFTHILPKGLDHILFVLGLYLLNAGLRPLLVQVTAFTIAHSITLGLGLYGVVNLPPTIVEPLIAASIVYVAVENLMTSRLHVWRPVIVFAFGLLHGLGFAGVLQEIGLPRSDFVTGLIAFNVGVEFGQLAVIALAWGLAGVWFGARPWYRARVVVPASLAIACVGLYWTAERVFWA